MPMTQRGRRLTIIFIWALLVCVLSISFGGNSHMAVSGSPGQTILPGADAQQLWKYITKDNPYKLWKSPPNQSTRYVHVNENPHGDWVAVYLNAEANESITYPTAPFQMKYGAVIVKENYVLLKGDPINQPPLNAVPVELASLTVMYKLKGYQRVQGEEEWFWVMFTCRNGQCDGSVATISDQAFVNQQIPMSQDKFAFFQGEVVTGKPWICIECHQRANISNEFSYGDYVWKLKPFAPK
jgi:hypothetical protein